MLLNHLKLYYYYMLITQENYMQANKLSAFLSGLGLAVVTVIVLTTLFNLTLMIAIAAGFLLGGLVTIVLIARSRGEKPQHLAKEVMQEALHPNPDALAHRVEEQLLQLNLQLRLKTTQETIIQPCEKLIDTLLEVVPRAMKESPDSEASFDLEKLSTDYFPDLINRFLALSEMDQSSKQDELLAQLENLLDTIEKAKQSLDKGTLNDFHISNAFLNAKH